jgi:hypothetical protein
MTEGLASVVLIIALVAGTVLIHYETLRLISFASSRMSMAHRSRIIVVIGFLVVAHILEIGLYAVAYFAMHHYLDLGTLAGEVTGTFFDFAYFSTTSYTTLGVGDVYPRGPMRLVSGVEAFNGLVLIGWSASYTYFAMRKLWDN